MRAPCRSVRAPAPDAAGPDAEDVFARRIGAPLHAGQGPDGAAAGWQGRSATHREPGAQAYIRERISVFFASNSSGDANALVAELGELQRGALGLVVGGHRGPGPGPTGRDGRRGAGAGSRSRVALAGQSPAPAIFMFIIALRNSVALRDRARSSSAPASPDWVKIRRSPYPVGLAQEADAELDVADRGQQGLGRAALEQALVAHDAKRGHGELRRAPDHDVVGDPDDAHDQLRASAPSRGSRPQEVQRPRCREVGNRSIDTMSAARISPPAISESRSGASQRSWPRRRWTRLQVGSR